MYMRKNHSDIKLGMEGKISSDLPISLGYGHAEKTGERSEAMQWRNWRQTSASLAQLPPCTTYMLVVAWACTHLSLSLYISTNSVEELAARTMIERIYKIDSFSRMLRFVHALTCLGTFTYPLKDDYHCGHTVAGQWHVEDGQHHANKLATARKLDDQDNNKKPERKQNKHIKQIYKTIVFL